MRKKSGVGQTTEVVAITSSLLDKEDLVEAVIIAGTSR